jgi:hypothetical protein
MSINIVIAQISERIVAAYGLYALHAQHPIVLNPFGSALRIAFDYWRARALGGGGGDGLAWVLWKILRGEATDVRSSLRRPLSWLFMR